jgi:hypothetical protein
MKKFYYLVLGLCLAFLSTASFAQCLLEKNAQVGCAFYGEISKDLKICINYEKQSENPPKFLISGHISVPKAGRFHPAQCFIRQVDSGSFVCGDFQVAVSSQNIPETSDREGYRIELVVEASQRGNLQRLFRQSRCEIGFMETEISNTTEFVKFGTLDCR